MTNHQGTDEIERLATHSGVLSAVIELRSRLINALGSGTDHVSIAEVDNWLDDIKEQARAELKDSK